MCIRAWFILFSLIGVFHAKAWDEEKLAHGHILTELKSVEKTKFKQGVAVGVVDASRDQIWKIITDYEHFPEFMPRTKLLNIKERTSTFVRYYTELSMPLFVSDVAYECKAVFTNKDQKIEFQMVPGTGKNVKNFYGSWEIEPFKQSETKNLVTYTLFFEPEKNYPAWTVNMGTTKSIRMVIRSLRDRVKQSHK